MKLSFWKHHPIADQTGTELAKETIEWGEKFDVDFVKITPAGSWQATCYGLKDYYEGDHLGRRIIKDRLVHDLKDWDKIKLFTDTPEPLKEQIQAVDLSVKGLGNKPLFVTVFNPITQAIQMAGIDTLKSHLKEDAAQVQSAIEIITENTIAIIKSFAEKGAKGLYFVTQGMQDSFFSYEDYERYAKNFDSICLNASKHLFEEIIFHIHGEEVFTCVDKMEEVTLHFEYNDLSIANAKGFPFCTGLSPKLLLSAVTNDQKQKELNEYLSNADLLTCGCVLPLDFPDEAIHSWIQFCHK